MNKYLVEFIGTFFLVFTIGMVVLSDGSPISGAIAIASALMVMIYAGGHISGAHYNPAVTMAVTLRGKCSISDVVPYIVVQLIGAVAAAAIALFMQDGNAVEPIAVQGPLTLPKVLIAEFLWTFALVYVILNVATAERTAGNSYYGIAISFTVLAGAITVGSISGGVFNPAVAVGLCVMKKVLWQHIWVYLAANLAGAAAAAVVFRIANGEDDE